MISAEKNYFYSCINPKNNFEIEFEKKLDNFKEFNNYQYCFQFDKGKMFFVSKYGLNNLRKCCIFNIKNGETSFFGLKYKNFIKATKGNILGFNEMEMSIISENGIELINYKDSKYIFKYGTFLSNNSFAFIKCKHYKNDYGIDIYRDNYLSLFDSEKLSEMKNITLKVAYYKDIKGIKNIDKKLFLVSRYKIIIFDYNLCIQTIIHFKQRLNKIFEFFLSYDSKYYINFFLDRDTPMCNMIHKKLCKINNFSNPYMLDSKNNIILSSKRYTSLIDKCICIYDKYIITLYNNEIVINILPKYINLYKNNTNRN